MYIFSRTHNKYHNTKNVTIVQQCKDIYNNAALLYDKGDYSVGDNLYFRFIDWSHKNNIYNK